MGRQCPHKRSYYQAKPYNFLEFIIRRTMCQAIKKKECDSGQRVKMSAKLQYTDIYDICMSESGSAINNPKISGVPKWSGKLQS